LQIFKKPHSPGKEFSTAPLVVLNNFPSDEEMPKLMAVMFQKLFPPINVQTVKLADCKRVILFSYNKQNKQVELRHYLINMKPTGVTKSVKRVITSQIPDLSKFEDISDYVLKENYFSDSEGEDTPESRISISNPEGNSHQQSIRLQELGPRLDLQLIKVQKDFCDGDVLFHEYVEKTPEEVKELEKKRQERQRLKKERKDQQLANVKKKQQLREKGQQVSDDEPVESSDGEDWDEDLKWFQNEQKQKQKEEQNDEQEENNETEQNDVQDDEQDDKPRTPRKKI